MILYFLMSSHTHHNEKNNLYLKIRLQKSKKMKTLSWRLSSYFPNPSQCRNGGRHDGQSVVLVEWCLIIPTCDVSEKLRGRLSMRNWGSGEESRDNKGVINIGSLWKRNGRCWDFESQNSILDLTYRYQNITVISIENANILFHSFVRILSFLFMLLWSVTLRWHYINIHFRVMYVCYR